MSYTPFKAMRPGELEHSDKQTGLVMLCVGAGMGTATIIERV